MENTIFKCGHYGVHVHEGCNNYTIYHNDFFDNGRLVNGTQALDEAGTGHLDNGTLKEGNYWSDYEGEDQDGDGIGDTEKPHQIPHYEDRYPLVVPRGPIPVIREDMRYDCDVLLGENMTVSRFYFDQPSKSIGFNITLATTTGYCNITVPNQLLKGAFKVYVDDVAIPCMLSWDQDHYFIYFNSTCFTFREHSIQNIRIEAETSLEKPRLTGDINNDGVVDIFDAVLLAIALLEQS